MHRLMESEGIRSGDRGPHRSTAWAASLASPCRYIQHDHQITEPTVSDPPKRQSSASEDAIACPALHTLLQAKLQTLFFSFYLCVLGFSPRCLRGLYFLVLDISDIIEVQIYGQRGKAG